MSEGAFIAVIVALGAGIIVVGIGLLAIIAAGA